MKKALLINISDIGDIVSSSVILDALRAQGFSVTFLMPKFVHSLWDTDKEVKLIGPDEAKNDQYDLVVDLTSDKTSRKLVRSVKARTKIGRIKSTWQKMRHWMTYTKMVDKKMDGHIVGDYYPILHALKDQNKRIPQLIGNKQWPAKFGFDESTKVVSIHFGAHNPKRVIPESLVTYAVQNLHARGYKVVLIGTEVEIAEEIIQKNNNIPIYHKLTLAEVKEVLLSSKLFIGADSGILHIAAALGVTSIGVYGPNVPRRSGPRTSAVSFFEQDLDCRPCNQNIECPIGVKCMLTLDQNKFLELILKKLNL